MKAGGGNNTAASFSSTTSEVHFIVSGEIHNHSSITVTTNIPKPMYNRFRVLVFKAKVEGWKSVYGLPAEAVSDTQKYEYVHKKLCFYQKLNPESRKIARMLAKVEATKPNEG
jgi:hypothetical protein